MPMVTTDHDENCDDIGNDKVEAILVLLVTSSWASFAHTDQTPAVVDEHNDDALHEDGDEVGSGKLFNMPPVLRHNISAQLGQSDRTQ